MTALVKARKLQASQLRYMLDQISPVVDAYAKGQEPSPAEIEAACKATETLRRALCVIRKD